MEITPRVHDLPVKLEWFPQPYSPNVHLVVDGGEGALIDAGFADDQSLDARLAYLKDLPGLRLRYIVLTHHHYDHSSAAHRLREATGARIVMHRLEEPLIREAAGDVPQDLPGEARFFREEAARAVPDEVVDDGDTFRVGGVTLRLVHTPGHTAGHICPFLEEERVLFAGDNVQGLGTTAIPPPPHGDMATYIDSLRKMQSLDAALICCGHGPPVREAKRKLQELIDHRRERDEQILALIAEGKDTLKRIVRAVYPEVDRHLLGMATGQILSHLHKLEREGKVRMRVEGEETYAELQE
ncbi:MAG: MBL fold metallo-hydrolase [Dehalococcoidia bacterium]